VIKQGKRACSICGTLFSDSSESCPVCALRGALNEPAISESPSERSLTVSQLRFEHYEIVTREDGTPFELGRGTMGITYKAVDVDLRCPVTLKIISEKYLGEESARLRFMREARAAASVRHPNVASVFHLGKSAGGYFYTMEFVEGETLETLIKRSRRLEVKLALEIATQIASGLAAVHRRNLVHRDIKPANVMVSLEDGAVVTKIIDLGLAKGATNSESGTAISIPGSFAGTPEFASPEQFAGVGIDIRSDLYSLGVTLWQMLAGQTPFRGSPAELMHQHLHASLPLNQLDRLPQPVIALLEVLLEKDPRGRFQNPMELLKAIPTIKAAIEAGQTIPGQTFVSNARSRRNDDLARPPGPPHLPPRWELRPEQALSSVPDGLGRALDRKPRLILIGAILAAILLIGSVIYLNSRSAQLRTTITPLPTATPLTTPAATARLASTASPTIDEAARLVLRNATKEQPWENSLGMKFVPVPGTQVFFSIWDTRIQDFRAFAERSGYDATGGMYSMGKDGLKQRGGSWKEPGFDQGQTHPVVGVSSIDAKAFCAWLTKTEQEAGQLPRGWSYRLPTDEEWSIAVGLGHEPGDTPGMKNGKITGIYPWGKQWPPPKGAGNYCGEESKTWTDAVIEGYNDEYAHTSPVGSFAANQFGLYDMGGNVRQWCEDWYDNEKEYRVLRGASWYEFSPFNLLSSARYYGGAPDGRCNGGGFRCVIAQVP
jgi:serine/threonine protein kinase